MRRIAMAAAALGLSAGLCIGRAWSQHEGHGGHAGMGMHGHGSDEAQGKGELEKLEHRIHALEQQLQDPKLSAKKRASIEKQLKKLSLKKKQMSGAGAAQATYACPMGDYSGPMTKDGRCPKCGMNLQKQQ